MKDNSDGGRPEGYFEKYFSALKDRIFEIPEYVPWFPDEREIL